MTALLIGFLLGFSLCAHPRVGVPQHFDFTQRQGLSWAMLAAAATVGAITVIVGG